MAGNDGDNLLAQEQQIPLKKAAERDPAMNEVEAVSSSETSTNINEPQSEIPQDNSPESTGGSVIRRDASLSSQIPSDNEQDTHLETTPAHTPDEIENGEDDEAESENESESAENFEDDILWNDSDSQPKRTPEKKNPQATPDFMKMMAERELEIAQKKFEEQATEEAIKELARQDFGVHVPDLDQALIQEQEEIYKMIQMDLETSKASRSGQTGGDAISAPWDSRSVQGGDIQQGEVGVESSAEQADEQASGLVTQTSGYDQTQSDTGNDSRQATASPVPDRVVDDLDEEKESLGGASEAPVSDPTIHGEGHLIKPTLEEGARPVDDVIDQGQLEFAVEVMGEDMQKLKLDEEEYFKKPEEEEKRKSIEDSSSKASSSENEDSKKDEDDQDDDGSPDNSPPDHCPPDDSPPNNSPSDHSPQDDHEDPSQNGAPRDTQDGNQHQFSQSGDLSNDFQDNGIAEGDDSQNDAPQALTSSDKKSNDLPLVLKPTPKATIQKLISEVKEWDLLSLPGLDSKDFPGSALQNVVQSFVNLGEAILRICDEKNGRGARVENGNVDMGSLIEMLTASKLAGNGIELANRDSQQAEVEDSKDGDAEIPKLIPDCSLWKSIDDQEAVSKNKAGPSVDLGPRNEEQTNLTDSSSSDHESKDLATIAEKVLHWAYEGFEKEYFRPRSEYNNYTNRLAEDLWKRQYQLCIAEAEFEAEKARFRDREFDMMDSQELKKREHAVEVREGVVKETERLFIERNRKLLEREEKMNRMERKSKEGKNDENMEGEGEDGDGEKKCKSQ